MDLWAVGEKAFYDPVLQIIECRDEEDVVTGVEYVLPTRDMVEGRLELTWEPEGAVTVTGPIKKDEWLLLSKEGLHPIVTLRREKKGRWIIGSPSLKSEQDEREKHEEWWLLVGCPVRELVFNPLMWQLREEPMSETGRPMLSCSSAQLGRVLKKEHTTLSDLRAVWHLNVENAQELM